MSGPKDYGLTYTVERLGEFRRRNEAVQRARAAQVHRMLDAARRTAAGRRRAEDTQRASAVTADLRQRAEASRAALAAANESAKRETATPPAEPAVEAVAGTAIDSDFDDKSAVVQGWADALAADTSVNTFAAAELAICKTQAARLPTATAADLDAMAAAAQALHDAAGQQQARFDTRNDMLRDVIASMNELGYFVSDPQLSDPADPASPVILKATCGSETVTTTVDLSSMVKSVWDGQEHEHCKNSFFDYMDKMKARGATVEPEREDLRERPILKQKGANQLPHSADATRQAGGR